MYEKVYWKKKHTHRITLCSRDRIVLNVDKFELKCFLRTKKKLRFGIVNEFFFFFEKA